jgi:Polyketide cyclase / dehydrase and lipid transport
MVIEKEIEINNSIEAAWKVLGHEFATPYRWASSVNHSEGHGKQVSATTCDERSCQTTMGNIHEKMMDYSDERHFLAYEITEGMPPMVKTARNSWQLYNTNTGKTRLKMKMEISFNGFWGKIFQPLMKIRLQKVADELIGDFAYYVGNGQVHPRKVKALSKLKK